MPRHLVTSSPSPQWGNTGPTLHPGHHETQNNRQANVGPHQTEPEARGTEEDDPLFRLYLQEPKI